MVGMKEIINALFIVLTASALTQICIYWLVYSRLAFYQPKQNSVQTHPLSVIICARNESARLLKYLPSVLEQDYPKYEVIVVNDCSWDETDRVLIELSKKYPHLKIVTIKEQEKYKHGKKFALTLGIKAAANEIVVLTDADCEPVSVNWLRHMSENFGRGNEIVLGYGGYMKSHGFLNMLIRFDTLFVAMQYLSSAIMDNPYMGVGRNLAYRKTVFFRSKGFAKHNHIMSGDDDLFVNENATPTNTSIELDPESFTYSEPKKTFTAWFSQKKRHMSTGKHYKKKHKWFLGLHSTTAFLFYTTLIALLILGFDWRILVSLYAAMLISRFPIIYFVSRKLKENDLVWAYPVLDPVHILLQPILYTSQMLTKQTTWK